MIADDRNRIGDACWYRQADVKPGSSHTAGKWRGGHLRAWSTDHQEFVAWSTDHEEVVDLGPGMFPVGVIEDDDTGLCHSIYVERICFATVPPDDTRV